MLLSLAPLSRWKRRRLHHMVGCVDGWMRCALAEPTMVDRGTKAADGPSPHSPLQKERSTLVTCYGLRYWLLWTCRVHTVP